jgi:hypothetical protein
MHATVQNGGACNRLDENKGTFGPFVAGQKDESNSCLHADTQLNNFQKRSGWAIHPGLLFVCKDIPNNL